MIEKINQINEKVKKLMNEWMIIKTINSLGKKLINKIIDK